MTLRPFQLDDAAALLALFKDTVRRVNSKDYSPAQIAVWASDDIDPDTWAKRFADRFVLVVDGRFQKERSRRVERRGGGQLAEQSRGRPPHMKIAIGQRVGFAESFAQGLTVLEAAPSSAASAEVRVLAQAIHDQLRRKPK